MKKINYGKQEITEEDVAAVNEVLRSDFLTQGPMIGAFEKAFAMRIGAKNAVACANGTAALHLSALALDVGPKSHFITTAVTFAASANCILYCGGKISLCDIDPITGLMDLQKLEAMISNRPTGYYTGIVAVHLAGFPLDMEKIRDICNRHDLLLIEDACHALGGSFVDSKGIKHFCGNADLADASIFSFHPVKHVTTGEGGMITTSSNATCKRLQVLRTHGIDKAAQKTDEPWSYEMYELGFNYRLPDILCAMGISQLKRLNENLASRHEIAKRYDAAFLEHTAIRALTPYGTEALKKQGVYHAHHLYIIKTDRRRELYDRLASKNIHCQVHYIPLYRLAFYERMGFEKSGFPGSEEYYASALSLPMYPSLTENEQTFVIETILNFFK